MSDSLTPLQSRYIRIPIRTTQPNVMLSAYAKNPTEKAAYVVSLVDLLAGLGLTVVGTPSVVANSTDLTISATAYANGLTSFFVSGGDAGTTYVLTFTAVFNDTSTLVANIWLPVASLSPNTSTPQIIAAGSPGPPGTGLVSVSQPNGDGTAVLTWANGATATIHLPQGNPGPGFTEAVYDSTTGVLTFNLVGGGTLAVEGAILPPALSSVATVPTISAATDTILIMRGGQVMAFAVPASLAISLNPSPLDQTGADAGQFFFQGAAA